MSCAARSSFRSSRPSEAISWSWTKTTRSIRSEQPSARSRAARHRRRFGQEQRTDRQRAHRAWHLRRLRVHGRGAGHDQPVRPDREACHRKGLFHEPFGHLAEDFLRRCVKLFRSSLRARSRCRSPQRTPCSRCAKRFFTPSAAERCSSIFAYSPPDRAARSTTGIATVGEEI